MASKVADFLPGVIKDELKIYFRKLYGRYNDLVHVQHYNTPLSQFLCDLVLCWCVLHTPDLTPPDITGYTLESTAGAWHIRWRLLFPGPYSHTWVFPSVCVVLSVTFLTGFDMIMD